jgi:major membrane immunogen (membrane-anchored lipoprotein)
MIARIEKWGYYGVVALTLAAALYAVGCGSSEAVREMTVEDRFKHAKELFDDHDYLEAIIILQSLGLPGANICLRRLSIRC